MTEHVDIDLGSFTLSTPWNQNVNHLLVKFRKFATTMQGAMQGGAPLLARSQFVDEFMDLVLACLRPVHQDITREKLEAGVTLWDFDKLVSASVRVCTPLRAQVINGTKLTRHSVN